MKDRSRLLIIETSCQVGQIALAQRDCIVAERRLDEARRHARDLVPALGELLASQGWKVGDLDAVIVSRGPGSYTGLRVGLMTAKTLAYATGCVLLAIDTFAAIALQAPVDALRVDVLADAQQDKFYVQRFARSDTSTTLQPISPLAVQPFLHWLQALDEGTWISGPGVRGNEERLRGRLLVDPAHREPLPQSLLRLGLERHDLGERDDFWSLEPLYLRPSAAEEKWLHKQKSV